MTPPPTPPSPSRGDGVRGGQAGTGNPMQPLLHRRCARRLGSPTSLIACLSSGLVFVFAASCLLRGVGRGGAKQIGVRLSATNRHQPAGQPLSLFPNRKVPSTFAYTPQFHQRRRHLRLPPQSAIRDSTTSIVADASSLLPPTSSSPYSRKDTQYPLWPALPLQPGSEPRITKQYEIVKGKVYGFEQKFGTLDVLVNIRMTVIVLSPSAGGGLLVYSPVAATKQCIEMIRDLEEKYGEVRHIVLPTTAVEHKVFFGPFSKNFKSSELWVAPGQWSFPLNLPLSTLGLWPRKAKVLPLDSSECDAEWLSDIDYNILKFSLGLAPFVEAAFYHKSTRSLLVTDSIIFTPSEPPEVVIDDPSALLFRAKDNARDPTPDTPEVRRKGWGKTVLFSQFLQPEKVSASLVKDYPALLRWDEGWERSWERVKDTLFVSPVVQILVFAQAPKTVMQWVDKVCEWPFDKIVPMHFKAPIPAGPREFRRAFEACIEGASPESVVDRSKGPAPTFQLPDLFSAKRYKIGLPWKELEGDFALLRNTEKSLRKTGVVRGPKGEYIKRL